MCAMTFKSDWLHRLLEVSLSISFVFRSPSEKSVFQTIMQNNNSNAKSNNGKCLTFFVYYLFFTMSDYQGQQHFIRNKNESTFIKVHSVNRNIWLHNSLKANWLLSAKV